MQKPTPLVDLKNLEECFPDDLSPQQAARAKTLFYKKLALAAHRFYGGKIQMLPRAPVPGIGWFNAWYTPGVSAVSTAIRDDQDASFSLSSRGNMVAVVSDGTRVLGDGDVTPAGGLGVMEGKAFLMKYLGGVDAVPLCIDSRGPEGENDPEVIIDLVKRCQHSFAAINLEDISQPNCFKVLDVLREECDIPVWHDDAQGTGCVTLAGLFGALRLAGKEISRARMVFYGAGASNTTIVRLIIQAGGDPANLIMFDSSGALASHRSDIESDPRYYRKWEICRQTNPRGIRGIAEAMAGADVLIALSRPGPDVIRPEWVGSMAEKSIVFACANPVPEIYPHAARSAGAYIVATGRGDFPNQVNNSLGFPGILKGALLVRARTISDGMAIAAARALAEFAQERGLDPGYIIPSMEESEVFPRVAAAVAGQAVAEGVARVRLSEQEVRTRAGHDISQARRALELMVESGLIESPPPEMIRQAWQQALAQTREQGR
jgi:malate dehydrogenase (oxaloacetate-decarboxylating)